WFFRGPPADDRPCRLRVAGPCASASPLANRVRHESAGGVVPQSAESRRVLSAIHAHVLEMASDQSARVRAGSGIAAGGAGVVCRDSAVESRGTAGLWTDARIRSHVGAAVVVRKKFGRNRAAVDLPHSLPDLDRGAASGRWRFGGLRTTGARSV